MFTVAELASLSAVVSALAFLVIWNFARFLRPEPMSPLARVVVLAEFVLMAGLVLVGAHMVQDTLVTSAGEALNQAGRETMRRGVAQAVRSGRIRFEELCMIETSHMLASLRQMPKYQDPRRLVHFEAKAYSQFGEDGILTEIFARVGTTNKQFVEFGAADGMENNTVLLLRQGWGGLWMDGDGALVARARAHFAPEVTAKRLRVEESFITAENVDELFTKFGVPPEPDLLSIDIDRNDYHVWKAISKFRPRVAVVEYNGIFPPGVEWVIDYKGDAWWDGTSKAGASLSALESLARAKGYELVACGTAGVNAFFVRKDLVGDKFVGPFTAQNHYEPPRYWQKWSGHPRVP
jgi:hypothetical protein